ncbi:MAG: DNA-directed RNA polymerase subunit omega [Oscillospiraceae bacterium]|jgi:DNA-directed RNA polymerase subunit omega|nr:DNA-directed RNA polymerase subunit omega [Oscillospiraceae bacterium]
MQKLFVKDILTGKKSKYYLVIAVAKRAREIADEAENNGEIILEKPVNLAIREFEKDMYYILEPEVTN